MWFLIVLLLCVACGDSEEMPRPFNFTGTLTTGNSVVLTRARAGVDNRVTLVSINANDWLKEPKEQLEIGAWVATFKSEVTILDPANTNANPYVIMVEYGEGGATSTFEISPGTGASIQIPSGFARISTYLENGNEGFEGNPVPGTPVTPPLEQRITCFLRRASLSIGARRSFNRLSPFANGNILNGRVPVHANSFLMFAGAFDLSGGGPTYDAANIMTFSSDTFALVEYTGQQIRDAALASAPLPIPAGATTWQWLVGAAAGIGAGRNVITEFYLDF